MKSVGEFIFFVIYVIFSWNSFSEEKECQVDIASYLSAEKGGVFKQVEWNVFIFSSEKIESFIVKKFPVLKNFLRRFYVVENDSSSIENQYKKNIYKTSLFPLTSGELFIDSLEVEAVIICHGVKVLKQIKTKTIPFIVDASEGVLKNIVLKGENKVIYDLKKEETSDGIKKTLSLDFEGNGALELISLPEISPLLYRVVKFEDKMQFFWNHTASRKIQVIWYDLGDRHNELKNIKIPYLANREGREKVSYLEFPFFFTKKISPEKDFKIMTLAGNAQNALKLKKNILGVFVFITLFHLMLGCCFFSFSKDIFFKLMFFFHFKLGKINIEIFRNHLKDYLQEVKYLGLKMAIENSVISKEAKKYFMTLIQALEKIEYSDKKDHSKLNISYRRTFFKELYKLKRFP